MRQTRPSSQPFPSERLRCCAPAAALDSRRPPEPHAPAALRTHPRRRPPRVPPQPVFPQQASTVQTPVRCAALRRRPLRRCADNTRQRGTREVSCAARVLRRVASWRTQPPLPPPAWRRLVAGALAPLRQEAIGPGTYISRAPRQALTPRRCAALWSPRRGRQSRRARSRESPPPAHGVSVGAWSPASVQHARARREKTHLDVRGRERVRLAQQRDAWKRPSVGSRRTCVPAHEQRLRRAFVILLIRQQLDGFLQQRIRLSTRTRPRHSSAQERGHAARRTHVTSTCPSALALAFRRPAGSPRRFEPFPMARAAASERHGRRSGGCATVPARKRTTPLDLSCALECRGTVTTRCSVIVERCLLVRLAATHAAGCDSIAALAWRQVRREDDAKAAHDGVGGDERARQAGARQEKARADAVRPVQPESGHHAPPGGAQRSATSRLRQPKQAAPQPRAGANVRRQARRGRTRLLQRSEMHRRRGLL